MVLAYVVLYLPYTVQYVTSAFTQINGSLLQAGRVFGGSPGYVFRRITLPMISRGIFAGWMMIFITDETPYDAACGHLVRETERLLGVHGLLLFPVPKYGRGLELLALFSRRLPGVPCFADPLFLENLAAQRAGGFWYRPGAIAAPTEPYRDQTEGVVFVSDPQLRSEAARETAERALSSGGAAVMTGTLEAGSYSERLFRQGKMALLRYPVHLNRAQYRLLTQENDFARAVPYHSPAFSAPRTLSF